MPRMSINEKGYANYFVEIAYPCWWAINGTAAAAPSALRLMIAGRLRIGLASALPAHCVLGNRSAESRTGSAPYGFSPQSLSS